MYNAVLFSGRIKSMLSDIYKVLSLVMLGLLLILILILLPLKLTTAQQLAVLLFSILLMVLLVLGSYLPINLSRYQFEKFADLEDGTELGYVKIPCRKRGCDIFYVEPGKAFVASKEYGGGTYRLTKKSIWEASRPSNTVPCDRFHRSKQGQS
jgi:hypothetical protein